MSEAFEGLNLALQNKDLFTSIILIVIIFLLIIVVIGPTLYFNRKKDNKVVESFNKITTDFNEHTAQDKEMLMNINLSLQKINNTLEKHDEHSMAQFDFVKNNMGSSKLSRQDTILLIKKAMLSGSYKKLDYLEKRLNKNNLKERKETIKRQVNGELKRLSDEEYLQFLNGFTYNGYKLGELIKENFRFDEFMAEIYDILFDNCSIQEKLKRILDIMKGYQNECVEDIKKVI